MIKASRFWTGSRPDESIHIYHTHTHMLWTHTSSVEETKKGVRAGREEPGDVDMG
jgi:hypothetical protein